MRKYLIDLDGTLYQGSKALPGAAMWIQYLNARKYDYLLCTNCPLHSPQTLSARLRRMGIQTTPNHILTSGMVLKSLFPNGEEIMLLGSSAYRKWLAEEGFSFSPQAKIAVVGYDPEMTYKDLQAVSTAVRNGAKYILTNEDNVIPQDGEFVPHTGAIGAAISYATNEKPLVLGKPYAPMREAALAILHCSADECMVVGDRMDTDMEFAFQNGMTGGLMLTGVATLRELDTYKQKPAYIFRNLDELMQWEKDNP